MEAGIVVAMVALAWALFWNCIYATSLTGLLVLDFKGERRVGGLVRFYLFFLKPNLFIKKGRGMAAPKVFVSSTCFDLSEIREQLSRFVETFGFEPVLSENGDVFYHPDLHTHDSCIHEVANCQIFILIIGGRFGGEYKADRNKSITNAEYKAARDSNIPVFTYVRDGVLSDHRIYLQNKKKEFVFYIDYPAIEKQEFALDIFGFIDEVRRSPTNNAFEGFRSFRDIESHLRKQWAGMFFDLLKSREVKTQIDATNHLIAQIGSSSSKLEELVKSLYRSSNAGEAEKEIASIETYSLVERFFDDVLFPSWLDHDYYPIDKSKFDIDNISKVSPENMTWSSYLVETGLFAPSFIPVDPARDDTEWEDGIECAATIYKNRVFILGLGDSESKSREYLFEQGVKKSTEEQRRKVLKRMLSKYSA